MLTCIRYISVFHQLISSIGYSRPLDLWRVTQKDENDKLKGISSASLLISLKQYCCIWSHRSFVCSFTHSLEHWSFLQFAWGVVADVDLESERFRWAGAFRYDIGAVAGIALLRKYHGKLYYLPADDPNHNVTPKENNEKKDNSNNSKNSNINTNWKERYPFCDDHEHCVSCRGEKHQHVKEKGEEEKPKEENNSNILALNKEPSNDNNDNNKKEESNNNNENNNNNNNNNGTIHSNLLDKDRSELLEKGWKVVNDEFTYFLASNVSHLSTDLVSELISISAISCSSLYPLLTQIIYLYILYLYRLELLMLISLMDILIWYIRELDIIPFLNWR